ncbi:MAG TPA: hypothetical protein VM450_16345 [Thermomicrobiales bacterium]|nr:hypothetical protein [Thermomicrobiales bacterium]
MSRFVRTRGARGAKRHILFAWLTVLMTVLSLSPAAAELAAAQPQPPAQDQAAAAQDAAQYLEIHVVECPPGTTGTGQQLFDACHANGLDGVDVQITATDPALGIDQAKTTTRVNGEGPGIVNTGDIPAGEYEVTVDLPADAYTFWNYCSVADGDEVVPATPDDAATATLTLSGTDVVCDWYAIPRAQQNTPVTTPENTPAPDLARIDLSVYTCDEAALDTDGRAIADLSAGCTTPASNVDLTLMSDATGEQTVKPVDTKGKVTFASIQPGTYLLYSDVPAGSADEFLFCRPDGGDRYEKDFNENGVTVFQDLAAEQLQCNWYVVATAAATAAPTEAQPAAEATAAPTEALTTDVPANDQVAAQAQQAGSISVTLYSCPQDYDVSANGETHGAFDANCTSPTSDVVMTLSDTANGNTNQQVSDANGAVSYPNLPPGTYTLYSGIPGEAATEYLFCVSEGVDYQKDFNENGVTTFTGLETEQIQCDWYIVPEDLRGEETGGSMTVHLAICPQEYTGDQLFNDCHGNGVADQQFTLSGPAGDLTATTTLPQTPGPGVATFTQLAAGDYTLTGGPPGDFGAVRLYCSDQATNQPTTASIESTIATLSIADNQDVLCDWYYIPENASGITPTPTPTEVPTTKAEILVTLFSCPETSAASGYAGATFADLDTACTTPVNDVSFSLSSGGGVPLSAATGVSGPGAVRFFDLAPADYTLSPALPATLTSAAVFCQIGDGDVYQKTLQNGATSFVDVQTEQLKCSWFAAPVPQPQPSGPTGSITVREFLCQKDRGEITDWERECAPGSTGTSFSLASSDGAIKLQATPDAQGVLVFSQLPDGYYELTQDTGVWCRAAAERVDSQSRVIVRDGGNTDVFLYECGQVNTLPSTGAGTTTGQPGEGGLPAGMMASLILAIFAAPVFAAGVWQWRRPAPRPVPVEDTQPIAPSRTSRGTHWMRFR